MMVGFQTNENTFPFQLYDALQKATQLDFKSVSWIQDGTRFMVHDRDLFMKEVLPKHFSGQSQFKSFQRQLNLYGFSVSKKGPLKGSFYHPYFVQDSRHLCHLITRPSKLLNPSLFCTKKRKQVPPKDRLPAPRALGYKANIPASIGTQAQQFQLFHNKQRSINNSGLRKLVPNCHYAFFNATDCDKINDGGKEADLTTSSSPLLDKPDTIAAVITQNHYHRSFSRSVPSLPWMENHGRLLEEFASELVAKNTLSHDHGKTAGLTEEEKPDTQPSASIFSPTFQSRSGDGHLAVGARSDNDVGVEDEIIRTFISTGQSYSQIS